MPLEIIGAGFGRTGTWSTKYALERLGLRCYHMSEVILNKENKSHLDFWLRVARAPAGTKRDWEEVFGKYRATVDNPACCVWRELMLAYPEAKVIMTLHPRGADAWYESTLDTIYFTEKLRAFKVLEYLSPFARKMGEMSRRLIWRRSLNDAMPDRDKAVARYHEHLAEVRAAVAPERLLVGPLCACLGVPPPDEPFPNVNDRAEIKKTIRDVIRGMWIMVGAIAGLALIVVFLLFKYVV
jgi:Sulfotransferase domain